MATDSPQPLRIDVRDQDGLPLVVLAGELDIASVPQLDEVLTGRIDGGAVRLVVDLQAVDYIDSTGLGCLAAARRKAREAGGDLTLACANERVLRLFAITGLDEVFTICRGAAEAARAAAGGG